MAQIIPWLKFAFWGTVLYSADSEGTNLEKKVTTTNASYTAYFQRDEFRRISYDGTKSSLCKRNENLYPSPIGQLPQMLCFYW